MIMLANDTFHIAVLPGDGIGIEVTAPTLDVLKAIEASTPGLALRFTEATAGADHYVKTGTALPDSTVKLCEQADAILLGACGLPHMRFIFDLYAGVRPARLIPGVPSPIAGVAEHGLDLVIVRESTEELFASMGKGIVTETEARETMVITRKTSERLFDFSLRLAARCKARGGKGLCTCVDKANVFKAFVFFRQIFHERTAGFPDVKSEYIYVDALAAALVRRPWDFDVLVTENMFGDILSDMTAGLIGGHGHGAIG
jgi:3-isopropylmalate dehydrogenase